ncbi:MAG: hypothetical protein AAF184_04305 [Pseudomonadota bacterium]
MTVVNLVGTILGGWLQRRGRIAEAKAEAAVERAKRVSDQSGIKDEIVLIIWSLPAAMAFIPGAAPFVKEGFEQLRQAPEWYVVGYVSICLAIYGIKPAAKQITKWQRGRDGKGGEA